MVVLTKPNGEPISEGEILCRNLDWRFKSNKNWLCAIVGQTGSGKSYTSIRIAELWYKFKFNEEFPVEHICFDLKELTTLLRSNKLRKGDIIIFEEAGVNVNNLEFQNKIQRIFQQVMQSFRSKNIGVIFNLPSIGFMNKGARVLLHNVFLTQGIDTATQEVVIKPLFLQYNTMRDQIYNKYVRALMNGCRVPIKQMRFHKPSKNILIHYEERKDIFVNNVMKRLDDEIDSRDGKLVDSKDSFRERIVELYNNGITSLKEMAKILGVTPNTLSRQGGMSIVMELNTKKHLEKTPNLLSVTRLAPLST